jgi:hypothetical protein
MLLSLIIVGNELWSSIIYRRVFLSCLSVTVRRRSFMPVPPKIVSRLIVVVSLRSTCGGARDAAFLRRSPRDSVLRR